MNAPIVRITNLNIQNFKNVVNGSLALENPRKDYKASIVGIYGVSSYIYLVCVFS